MAVYVDRLNIPWRGRKWCHLVADSLDELHTFAAKLGLKRRWFQLVASYPHYDIPVDLRGKALQLGAKIANRRQIILAARQLKAEYESRFGVHIGKEGIFPQKRKRPYFGCFWPLQLSVDK